MSTLRVVSAVFLIWCGWSAGDAVRLRIQAHLEELGQIIRLLKELEQEISYRRADLNALSKKLQQKYGLHLAQQTLQSASPPRLLSGQEAACFTECFSGLGHAEAEQECIRLHFYQERFRSFLQEQEEATRPERQLARKLGIAIGLAAAILFL